MRGPRAAGGLALILVAASLGGCTFGRVRAGHPIELGAIDRVAVGQSRAEVLRALGPPDVVERVPGGQRFEYWYQATDDSQVDLSFLRASFSYEEAWARADRLAVRFDHAGVVLEKALVRQTDPEAEPR